MENQSGKDSQNNKTKLESVLVSGTYNILYNKGDFSLSLGRHVTK